MHQDSARVKEWLEKRSGILRRSGVAVGLIMDLIEWAPDVCYQVGIGFHSQEVGVLLEGWPTLKFIGCEPHPDIVSGLRKGKVKGLSNGYPGPLHQVAVSDHVGKERFYSKKRHKDGSSLHPHQERLDEEYYDFEVDVTTLDALFPDGPEGHHNMLWLDCEGSELQVLNGAEQFMNGVELVNVELTGRPPGDNWCNHWDVDRWLQDHGFYMFWIHTQRSSAGQRDGIYVRENMFDPRFACCRCQVERWEKSQRALLSAL